MCADVVMELSDFAKARGQQIVPELQKSTVWGREHLLFVAVRNLVHNALSHSPHGSPIVLRCGEGQRGAWIEVEDRGVGFPPTVREEVMSADSVDLRQRDSRMAGGRSGMGLGLRLSKAIFRRHEASMRPLDRRPPPGTIMLIEFPMRRS
jgi:two-component system phosphate regulon sensor histidine kinase PhoR